MKKYIARLSRRWGCEAEINEVDVDKETEKSVWVNGNRRAKHSEYEKYFDTWDQAKEALLGCQTSYVESMRTRLERANSVLGNIKGMRQR